MGGAGAGAGAGAGTSCATMDPLPSTVDGSVLGAAAGDSDLGADDAGTRSGGAPSSDADAVGTTAVAIEVPRKVAAEVLGGLEPVIVVPLLVALPFVLTGGHSRAVCCSSFTASLVLFEVALAARDGGPDEVGWRFCCCSKRPMRFATD